MLKAYRKESICKNDLKCISINPLTVGGNSKITKTLDSGTTVMFDSTVSSLKTCDFGILFGLADGRFGFLDKEFQKNYTNLHKSNICAIDMYNNTIITGSWDHSAILLQKTENSSTQEKVCIGGRSYDKHIFPHLETVWCAKLISENEFVTGCADKKVRIFNSNRCIRELDYHSHVVRGLNIDGDAIFSVDNYGTVIKSSQKGMIMKSRNLNEMCFCICAFEEYVLVGGENGNVFVLNKDLEVLETVKLPCSSCWSIAIDNVDILVAGSDGSLYFLRKLNDIENDDEAVELGNENTESNDGSNKSHDDPNSIDQQGVKNTPDQIFVTNGVRYKTENGRVYMDTGNEWELVGDVEKKQDHSFTVELDGKEYVLSFNNDENVHEVASRFIHENKLSQSHHEEIVNYINQNFKASTLYKKYNSIDLNGISKLLSAHPIIEILKKIEKGENFSMFKEDEQNIYQIEALLFKNKEIPMFIILDICKYLSFKKINLDLSFLFNYEFRDKKEAKAFTYLMTNLVEMPPFDISKLHRKLKGLKDLGYLTDTDVFKYEENVAIKKRSQ